MCCRVDTLTRTFDGVNKNQPPKKTLGRNRCQACSSHIARGTPCHPYPTTIYTQVLHDTARTREAFCECFRLLPAPGRHQPLHQKAEHERGCTATGGFLQATCLLGCGLLLCWHHRPPYFPNAMPLCCTKLLHSQPITKYKLK